MSAAPHNPNQQPLSWWEWLSHDENGVVVSTELLMVAVVLILGMITGASALRDSVVSELSDVGGSIQDLNQSFTIHGVDGASSTTAGMDFLDVLDHCDNVDDVARQADNSIVFDCPPDNEGFFRTVPRDDLNAELLFNGSSGDSSPSGSNNGGTLQNGAAIVGGQLVLDGVNDYVSFSSSTDINTGTFFKRTIHLEFEANDVTTRQVIYQEGSTARGITIYIENGLLNVGAWNIPETGFQPTFISSPVAAGQPTSVTFVLDAGPGITTDGMSVFVDGTLAGTAPASEMYNHVPANIGGAIYNTFFDGGGTGTGSFFSGTVEDFSLYGTAFHACDIPGL